ncbi:MAG: hypothetical protein GY862_35635 [Gammaproteobacteria bacterium]|nr:hypothetical protein [Gammaproteobacteria bacterium]
MQYPVKTYVIGILLLCFFSSARAQMLISNPIVHFDPGRPSSQDVEVINTGRETLYAQVSVFKVPHPEISSKQREALTDPRSAGLLVSPKRMMIPAGRKKLLRLMVRLPATDKDLVYRVRVEPKIGGMKGGKGQKQAKQIGVKILVGYEMLVIVRPQDAKPDVRVEREGRRLKFSNQGNTSLLIRKLLQCSEDGSDCAELTGWRLYAGEQWEVELPRDGAVDVYESYSMQNSVRRF